MTPLKNYLEITWPSLTVSAAVTGGGVALAKLTTAKVWGVALAVLGSYMLINHVSAFFTLKHENGLTDGALERFNKETLGEKTKFLRTVSFLGTVAAIGCCLKSKN